MMFGLVLVFAGMTIDRFPTMRVWGWVLVCFESDRIGG